MGNKGMQSFKKIYSVIMKLNRYFSTFRKRPIHSNFGKKLKGHRQEFLCIYLYIAASLFPKYLYTFLDVLSKERINKIKILRNFREQTQIFDKPTLVVLFEFSQRSSAKCCG